MCQVMQHSRLSEKILFSGLGEAESMHETEESRDQEGPPAMRSQVPRAPNLRCIKASQAQPWKKAKFRHLSGRWWWTPAFPSSTVPGFLIQSVGRQSIYAPQGETSLWACPLTAEQTQVLCESPGPIAKLTPTLCPWLWDWVLHCTPWSSCHRSSVAEQRRALWSVF